MHLLAQMRARVYVRLKDLKTQRTWSMQDVRAIHLEETILMRRQWEIYLLRSGASGARTREAILPSFDKWMDRGHGQVGFRLTQLLTGHGCFGSYLARIQKVDTDICEHCTGGAIDTPEHTLGECVAWNVEREMLIEVTGPDLTLVAVVRAMLDSRVAWDRAVSFAEAVMSEKERRERVRQLGVTLSEEDSPSSPSLSSFQSYASSSSWEEEGNEGSPPLSLETM